MNAAVNLASYVVAVLITFFLSPYLIRTLGDGRYAAWSLIAELTGYASLLDLGLRGAVSYFVAFESGRRDEAAMRSLVASAFWPLAFLGVAAGALGVGVAAAFPALFNIGSLDPDEIFQSMAILSVLIGLTLPCSLLHSILVGLRQQAYGSAADILVRVAVAAAIALALREGHGLVALSLITLGGRLVTWSIQAYLVRSAAPGLSLMPAWFRGSRLRDLAGYGSKSLVINLSQMFINRVDLVIVGAFVGVEKAAAYTLGAALIFYISQLISSLAQAYTPYFSNAAGANNLDQLRQRFSAGLRHAALLLGLMAGGMFAFGKTFLGLWVGERFVTGGWMERSDTVMYILLAAHLPRVLQSISWQLLFGIRKVGFLMWLNAGEAAVKLAASLILVREFALAGVAMGTLLPSLVAHGILLPAYVIRVSGLPAGEYLWRAPRAGILTGVATSAAGVALIQWLPPANWTQFFSEAGLAALAGCVCIWTLGLHQSERERLSALAARR